MNQDGGNYILALALEEFWLNAGYFRVLASFNSSEIGWNEWLSAMFSGQFFSGPEGSNIGFQKAVLESNKFRREAEYSIVHWFLSFGPSGPQNSRCVALIKRIMYIRDDCIYGIFAWILWGPQKSYIKKYCSSLQIVSLKSVFVTNAKKLALWKRQMFKLSINFRSTMHFTHVDSRFDCPFHFEKVALFIWLRSVTWEYFKCRQRLTSLVGMGEKLKGYKIIL